MQEMDLPTRDAGISKPTNFMPWVICGIGMLFYCYAYFLRIAPSVMMDDLLKHFHITAGLFGNLTAFYYYSYTPMQLPVGLIIDRYNIRLVLTCACLLAVVGLGIFVAVDNYYLALMGRFLIGLGSAFAYISVLKLATLWLPPNRFAMVAGLTTSLGMVAAIFSDNYLEYLVQRMGYQQALYSALVAGVILSILIVVMVRGKNPQRPQQHQGPRLSFMELLKSLKMMLMNPQMWLIGIIGCLLYMPASVFLDVWGVPYLEHVNNLSPVQAVHAVSLVFIGWIISSPLIGSWSDRIGSRRYPLLLAGIISTITIFCIFYLPNLSHGLLYTFMFILGLACGAHPLVFSLGKESYSRQLSGTSTALTNTLIMIGGVIFQPVVGLLLDWHAKGAVVNGVHVYSASDYRYALSILPIALAISIVLVLLTRDTRCRQPD